MSAIAGYSGIRMSGRDAESDVGHPQMLIHIPVLNVRFPANNERAWGLQLAGLRPTLPVADVLAAGRLESTLCGLRRAPAFGQGDPRKLSQEHFTGMIPSRPKMGKDLSRLAEERSFSPLPIDIHIRRWPHERKVSLLTDGTTDVKKIPPPSLTSLELALMQVIWQQKDTSVEDLRRQLADARHLLALPSVRTMLAILQKKGFVERRLVGRAYIYNAIIAAADFQNGFVRDLLKRVFNGSATDLVTALLNRELLTRQELAQVKKMIRDFEGGKAMNLENSIAGLAHHWLIRLLPLSPFAVTAFLFQSTLFIALIFAADKLLRRYAASAKVLLWTYAIMFIPLLTVISNETPPTRFNEFVGSFLAASQEPSTQRAPQGVVPADKPGVGTGVTELTVVNPRHLNGYSVESALNWTVLLYCLTALTLLGRISLGWIRLAQLRRTSSALPDHKSAGLLHDVMGTVRYRGTCALRHFHRIESPLSFGV
jgi:BlaI family transcriptional regulator, penicillinase repressor